MVNAFKRARAFNPYGVIFGSSILLLSCLPGAYDAMGISGGAIEDVTPGPAAVDLTLNSANFWDVEKSGVSDEYVESIKKSLAGMPLNLKTSNGSPSQKALKLQWALKAANESPAKKVELVLESGQYDFSAVGQAHASTPTSGGAAEFLPKLYVARSNLLIRGSGMAGPPKLFYRGAGKDGVNHGRVLLMVQSGLTGVRIEGLHFEGDHLSSEIRNASYYAHENNAALLATGYRNNYSYALLKVGYTGGKNEVVVKDCTFTRINYHGLDIVGNAEVINSTFAGVMPQPSSDSFFSGLLEIKDIVRERKNNPGMGYMVGVNQTGRYGKSKIIGSRFNNLVQGITGSGFGPGSIFSDNHFNAIADHGIYLIGVVMPGGLIARNSFTRMFGQSIKLAGSNVSGSSPLDSTLNLRGIMIQQNEFRINRRESLEIAGTFNTIRDNVIHSYSSAEDPAGFYNPEGDANGYRPDFRLSHRAGGVNYWNHVSFNYIVNNKTFAGTRKLSIFLQHYSDEPQTAAANDRSLGFNYFAGAGQKVYFRSKIDSKFAPVILSSNSELSLNAPTNCLNCYPDAAGYRETLELDWAMKLKAGPRNAYLVKYAGAPDIFFIGANGEHQRINPSGRVFRVLGAADLDGDGWDEIYSSEAGALNDVLYGAIQGQPLPQWAVARPGGRLTAFSFSSASALRSKLYATFSNQPNLAYSTRLRDDGLAHVMRDAYPLNGAPLPAPSAQNYISATQLRAELQTLFFSIFSPGP